jgi:hypothetical protein
VCRESLDKTAIISGRLVEFLITKGLRDYSEGITFQPFVPLFSTRFIFHYMKVSNFNAKQSSGGKKAISICTQCQQVSLASLATLSLIHSGLYVPGCKQRSLDQVVKLIIKESTQLICSGLCIRSVKEKASQLSIKGCQHQWSVFSTH